MELTVDNYQPVQLSTRQLVDTFWPLAGPLLDRCVCKATRGEYLVEDLYRMAIEGRAVVFVVTNDPTGMSEDTHVTLALVVEPVLYPRLNTINIIALGGSSFNEVQRRHFESFKGWAYMNGARAIEASVSPAMMRVLKRWGFEPAYVHARLMLEK